MRLLKKRKYYMNSQVFMKTLYTSKTLDEDSANIFFNDNVPKISENVRFICDETITIDECTKALSENKVNKSPGTDGFTVELYKYFWDDIKHYVY